MRSACFVGAWRSLVARLPWAQEVPSSNLGAPTNSVISPAASNNLHRRPLHSEQCKDLSYCVRLVTPRCDQGHSFIAAAPIN